MYVVDERDSVVPLGGLPQSSVGAPTPVVLADEHRVLIAYYLQAVPADGDGSTVRSVSATDSNEPIAIVRFDGCAAHMFGPPNDEAFSGHPLAARGLEPYATFEVKGSSWIRTLERMNSVHPYHRPERFWKLRHLIFAFHDSTFECVCEGFELHRSRGSLKSILPRMVQLLEWEVG